MAPAFAEKLFPSQVRERIPRIGSSGDAPLSEVTAQAKIVDQSSNWRWYLLEWDGEDTCFGLILTGNLAVAGQFTLSELEGLRDAESSIRCDTAFEPRKVANLMKDEPALSQLFAGSGLGLVGLEDG